MIFVIVLLHCHTTFLYADLRAYTCTYIYHPRGRPRLIIQMFEMGDQYRPATPSFPPCHTLPKGWWDTGRKPGGGKRSIQGSTPTVWWVGGGGHYPWYWPLEAPLYSLPYRPARRRVAHSVISAVVREGYGARISPAYGVWRRDPFPLVCLRLDKQCTQTVQIACIKIYWSSVFVPT